MFVDTPQPGDFATLVAYLIRSRGEKERFMALLWWRKASALSCTPCSLKVYFTSPGPSSYGSKAQEATCRSGLKGLSAPLFLITQVWFFFFLGIELNRLDERFTPHESSTVIAFGVKWWKPKINLRICRLLRKTENWSCLSRTKHGKQKVYSSWSFLVYLHILFYFFKKP